MKYSIMTYLDTVEGTNIGDYIQSLAAAQYLPQIDYYICREKLDLFDQDYTKLIMNGWFTHDESHWIPSKKILPLFVAFHINSSHKDKILTPEGIAYLKKHQPIGCRDIYTVEILKSVGIEAYFSGCLTLTLDKKYKVNQKERTEEIFIVDPIFNIKDLKENFTSVRSFLGAIKHNRFWDALKKRRFLNKIIDKSILKRAIYTHHMLPPNDISDADRFSMAEDLLKRYARAKLVITSRIHCALPCLALGTPVIFINSFTDSSNKSRLKGIIDLFNHIDIDLNTGKFSSSFNLEGNKVQEKFIIQNPDTFKSLANGLKTKCSEFI